MKMWLIWILAVMPIVLTGCDVVGEIDHKGIFGRYDKTVLKQSTSADVLSFIQDTKTEHLSQSESVLASWGNDWKTRTHWFNLVAFDEEQLTATRKYVFTLEDYRGPNTKPRAKLRLDIAAVIDSQTLNAAYPTQNQMRLEIIKKLKTSFLEDSKAVDFESQALQSSSMMVMQAFNNLLNTLNQSPALAEDLSKPEGLEFDHMTLGVSRARMLIEGDIAKLKIKAGKGWFTFEPFEKHDDVKNM
jgi:hypothetical protein